jgi:nitrogen fixation/metabolism regulation signal transduction histidine kinase
VVLNLIVNAAEAVDDHGGDHGRDRRARRSIARLLEKMTFGDERRTGRYVFIDVVDNGRA